MITAVDDEDFDEVALSTLPSQIAINEDPFNLQFGEVKKLKGLSKDFVRKTNRDVAYKSRTGFFGKDGAISKQVTDEIYYGYGYLDCVTPPHNIDYLTKLYDISPAHHAAVNSKVESVFGLGWNWVESPKTRQKRESIRTDKGIKSLEQHLSRVKLEMTDWLEDVNNLDVWDEIMKKVGVDYESTGNGYFEIGRTQSGDIGYIGHVPSKHVRIRRLRDGFVQVIANRVVFFNNFGDSKPSPLTEDLKPNEVIHFRKYSPTHVYYGVPDIIAAKGALAGNEFANRYNLDYFENKAIPRHVIIVKGGSLSTSSQNKLIEFFETGLRGKHHRSIYIPLGNGTPNGPDPEIEFKSIEADQQDFSFGEYRQANNEEIFMAHRTPSTRAGVFGKNIGLAAASDADKVFKEGYSRPEQAIAEKKLAPVFKSVTDMVVFKLNELSLVDSDTQSQIDERDLRAGVVVPDEVRRGRGMVARPDNKGMEVSMLNPQQKAEATAQATASRTRDSERQAASSAKAGDTGTRNPQGKGRKVG